MGISLEKIRAALAETGASWNAGATVLSGLPLEEQKKRLGMRVPEGMTIAQVAGTKGAPETAGSAGAPAAYDLRNVGGRNFVTPIKDQADCGSCVSFGVVASVESNLRVQRGDPNLNVDFSEGHLFFVLGRSTGAGCSTGWLPEHAYAAWKAQGVVDEACLPYAGSATNASSLCADWANRVTKITGSENLTNNPARMKEAISTKGAIVGCFEVFEDFFSYRSGVYKHVTGASAGGHCVSIIGYNDAGGYWICKNSWGEGWGDRGFFNIAYGECYIDTWQNIGATGIENTGWQSNRIVNGLWTINQDRNAFAHIDGLGWRKISPDNDNIFFDMLSHFVAAKAARRPVNFYEEQGVIKQVYVF